MGRRISSASQSTSDCCGTDGGFAVFLQSDALRNSTLTVRITLDPFDYQGPRQQKGRCVNKNIVLYFVKATCLVASFSHSYIKVIPKKPMKLSQPLENLSHQFFVYF